MDKRCLSATPRGYTKSGVQLDAACQLRTTGVCFISPGETRCDASAVNARSGRFPVSDAPSPTSGSRSGNQLPSARRWPLAG